MKSAGLRLLLSAALSLLPLLLQAQAIEPLPFKSHAEEVRFQKLTAELRCLQCQNESLADSGAPLAHDLRDEVFQLMQKGQSDDQIKQYLVDRYSNFVLYDPPLDRSTWLLWFGPLALFLAGGLVVAVIIRKRSRSGVSAADITSGENW
ncbi:cytochrome c-type biogenesis protein [Frateuria aurantia]